MLKKFLEKNPEYEEKVSEFIKKGQIQMPFAGNNIVDSNMVNGEGIVRNYLYGREYLKEKYNLTPYGMDRSDAFGNSAQLPQIARKFGTKWIFNIAYSEPDNLYWEGLDGSRVLTWQPPKVGYTGGYYKYRPCPACNGFRDKPCSLCGNRRIDLEYMEKMRVKLPEALKDFDGDIPKRIYCGGEEILPSDYIIEWAKKNADKYDIEFANFDDYLPYIQDLIDKTDEVGYDKIHSSREINCNNTGTFVTRINTKKTVRENENSIMGLEALAVANMLGGKAYPKDEIEKFWEKYFFTIFHDSIPATHVDAGYSEIMDTAKEIKSEAEALKNKIISENTKSENNIVTVYNPCGSMVSAETEISVKSDKNVCVKDENGEKASITEYSKNGNEIKIKFLADKLGAFSKRVYKIEETDEEFIKNTDVIYEMNEFNGMPVLTNEVIKDNVSASENTTVIENDNFIITAVDSGIKEIFDKKLGKAVAEESEYKVGEWILEHDEGSPWATHSPDMRRQKLSEYTHLMRVEKTADTQRLVFMIRPGDIDGNAVMGIRITYSVILKRESDKVDFEADVFWHTQNYRLRIAIPTIGDAKHFYEIPYGVMERKPYKHNIVFESGATNWASAAGDYPAINWAGVEKEAYSLAMFNKGTPSYQINKDSKDNSVIYLSVLRSPSIGSYLYSPTEYSMTAYDGMRDCGDHHFEYAIKAYENGFDKNDAVLDGVSYNSRLMTANGNFDIAMLPTLLCDDARISSIKLSQNKKGIIIRINEYHGKDTNATLEIPSGIKAKTVYETDLKEDIINELELKNNKVDFSVKHFEIKTLYIEL